MIGAYICKLIAYHTLASTQNMLLITAIYINKVVVYVSSID